MATNTNNNYRKGSVKGLQNGAMFEVCNLIEIDFRFSHISILGKNNDGEIMTIKRILNQQEAVYAYIFFIDIVGHDFSQSPFCFIG